jgi:hypothetical protein
MSVELEKIHIYTYGSTVAKKKTTNVVHVRQLLDGNIGNCLMHLVNWRIYTFSLVQCTKTCKLKLQRATTSVCM